MNSKSLLLRIGSTAFREHLKKNISYKDTYAKERDTLKKIVNDRSGNVPREARERAAKMLDNPNLYRKEMVVNPNAEKRMSEQVEGVIKEKIRTGELEKPDDSHLKKMWQHQSSQEVKNISKELNNPSNLKVNYEDNRN